MPKKDLTITSEILLLLHAAEDCALPFISRKEFSHRAWMGGDYNSARAVFYRLQKRGLLKFIRYKENRFVQLTKQGQMEALLQAARVYKIESWDGKWRLIVFDIPEDSKHQRDRFRRLLLKNNFIKLQGSVFISPYPLNAAAIEYLKESGLIEYIRILRVDAMDKDGDLRKHFGLK